MNELATAIPLIASVMCMIVAVVEWFRNGQSTRFYAVMSCVLGFLLVARQ
jgi:hypothetical protein